MFNASYFTYDGVFSGTYGLKIADFGDEAVVETPAFSPTLSVNKPANLNRFFHNGITYENAPQYQFCVISETPIGDVFRRKILTWLSGRNAYKTLRIHQPDLEKYHYNCVFTDISIICINGNCHGLRMTANFDSNYQYGEPVVRKITSDGTPKIITINNKSDIYDDYVYPTIKFTSYAYFDNGELDDDDKKLNNCNISIYNQTDDVNREFKLNGLELRKEFVVDNELRSIVGGSGTSLDKFNKNWLRLRSGINSLKITVYGDIEIICPSYIMMGF